jgi:hypothetical protein
VIKQKLYSFFFLIFTIQLVSAQVETTDELMKVDQMPYLQSCVEKTESKYRQVCTENFITTFIAQNINLSKIKNASGELTARFLIEENGKIKKIEIISGINKKVDQSVVKVLKDLPKFIPGEIKGKTVPVYYTIPIHFGH